MPAIENAGEGLADDEPLPINASVDRRQPVGDQIYQALREAIVTVRLMPGASISENKICRHFGVSRTPARAAILRLTEEGLIDVYPQQGSFVSPIRMGGVEDARFIRRSLEVSILLEAAKVWTPKASAQSRAILATQDKAIRDGDLECFYRDDRRFHRAFAIVAGREGVWDQILGAMSRLTRILRLFGSPDRLPEVIDEHQTILDALDAHDVQRAVGNLEYHLDKIFVTLRQVPDRYRPYVED